MKKSFLTLLSACLCIMLQAQVPQQYTVHTGQEASEVIPRSQHFYYPDFQRGQVFYPQGKRSDVLLLNYNTLLGVMQYIDHDGDTLFIPEESNIFKYVRIGGDLFYHHFRDGYFNLQTRHDYYNLGTRVRWKIDRRDLMVYNGYGTSVVSAGSTLSERRVDESVVPNQELSYVSEQMFFLIGPRDAVFRANRAGFFKAFAAHKEEISAYIRAHGTDFGNKESLKELIAFANGLQGLQSGSIAHSPKAN